jgi:putative RNA 2'-phosphotransferase
MTTKDITRVSKFLSLVLRHQPQEIGIVLDDAGWVPVRELLDRCNAHRVRLTLADLEEVVATNSKKRFAFSEDRLRIRANQGHSVGVDLGYPPIAPPPVLYHGTHERAVDSIRVEGIHKGNRHHVHLTALPATAVVVGERRGTAVVLSVAAIDMHRDGHLFYKSDNDVWLTEHVPARYIRVEKGMP